MDAARRDAATRAWLLAAADAALIFYVSSLSQPIPSRAGFRLFYFLELYNFDKVAHMLEYGLFGWLLTRALAASRDFRSLAKLALVALALGALYGASDEWHQSFVPKRDSSVFDWMADVAGTSAGIALWLKRKVSPHARH